MFLIPYVMTNAVKGLGEMAIFYNRDK